MFEITNPKTKEGFKHLLESLLIFLKALLCFNLLRKGTAMVIGDEEISFMIDVLDYDEDENEDEELH